MAKLFEDPRWCSTAPYQLNVGGNMDFKKDGSERDSARVEYRS